MAGTVRTKGSEGGRGQAQAVDSPDEIAVAVIERVMAARSTRFAGFWDS
jgi:hypothetical protein